MGTSFEKVYDFMVTMIDDYRIDKKAKENYEVIYMYLFGFVDISLSDFYGCIKSLDYEKVVENIGTDIDPILVDRFYFKETLDGEEIKIIAKIAVSYYRKRIYQDYRAESMITKREGGTSISERKKIDKDWYQMLIKEYESDINNYQMRHLGSYPYWSGLV